MAEELPETGEESGETVGTGCRARAWRGGGTRLGAPCRFGGAAGRAGPVLGEPTEAWRVGFSERVVPEPARIAAMGLVPAAKAQEQLLEFGFMSCDLAHIVPDTGRVRVSRTFVGEPGSPASLRHLAHCLGGPSGIDAEACLARIIPFRQ